MTNPCGTCGAATGRDARFCAACGASLDAAPVDLVFDLDLEGDASRPSSVRVEPEANERSAAAGPILIGAAILVALLAGLFLLNSDDDDDPEAADTPVTTTIAPESSTPSEDEADEPSEPGAGDGADGPIEATRAARLDWEFALDLEGTWPVAIVEHEADVYLFAAGRLSQYGYSAGGMSAWRSHDGQSWESLGQVLDDDITINGVTAGPRGLLAAGTDGDDAPSVWRSLDGRDWSAERLPPSSVSAQPAAVAATPTRDVVLGREGRDNDNAVSEALSERLDGDRFWGYASDGSTVSLTGPFGLVLAEFTYEELGVEPDDYTSTEELSTEVWSAGPDGQWQSALLASQASNVATLPNGDVLLMINDRTGTDLLRSSDGLSWQPTTSGTSSITSWGGGIAGLISGGTPAIRFSADGDTWRTVVLGDLAPSMESPRVSSLRGGPDGLVASLYDSESSDIELPSPRYAALIKDGFTLSGQSEHGYTRGLVLERDGAELLQVYNGTPPQGLYRADLNAGTITFLDPESGEPLVDFTLDELDDLSSRLTVRPSTPPATVLVSTDGEEWSVNTLDRIVGPAEEVSAFPGLSGVAHGRVFVTILGVDGRDTRLFSADLGVSSG